MLEQASSQATSRDFESLVEDSLGLNKSEGARFAIVG